MMEKNGKRIKKITTTKGKGKKKDKRGRMCHISMHVSQR